MQNHRCLQVVRLLSLVVSITIVLLCGPSFAADIIQVSPKQDAWATYHFRIVDGETKSEKNGEFTYSLLNRRTVNKDVVWTLQYSITSRSNDQQSKATIAATIPEKVLLKKFDFRDDLRDIVIIADGKKIESKRFPPLDELPKLIRHVGFFVFAGHGFYRDAGKQDKPQPHNAKSLRFQRGKLKCDNGTDQQFVYTQKVIVVDDGVESSVPFEYRTKRSMWKSKKVPLGAAMIHFDDAWTIDNKLQGTRTIECLVSDFGLETKHLLKQ